MKIVYTKIRQFLNTLSPVYLSVEEVLAKSADEFAKRDYVPAFERIHRALEVYPDDVQLNYMAGYHYEQTGQFDKGVIRLEKVVISSPNQETHFRLGLCYRGLGLFDKAFAQFMKSYLLDKDNEPLRKILVDCALSFNNGLEVLKNDVGLEGLTVLQSLPLDILLKESPSGIIDFLPDEVISIKDVVNHGEKAFDWELGDTHSGITYLGFKENVAVVAGSDLVYDLRNNRVAVDIFRYPQAAKLDLTFNPNVYGFSTRNGVVNFKNLTKMSLSKAIVLLSATSNHYGHWFFEHLPRLELLLKHKELESVPLLIDANLHPNHIEMLNLILQGRFNIITADTATLIEIENAYLLGYRTYSPTLVKPGYVYSYHDAPVSLKVLQFLRAKLRKPPQRTSFRLYFSRKNSTWRKVLNEDEIISYLEGEGFTIIEAEKMSFSEMTDLVARASVIVGPLGSAMNNVVFAQSGTNALFLSSPYVGNYITFLSSLNDVGIRAEFLCGRSQEGSLLKHASYSIPLDSLKKVIDAIVQRPVVTEIVI